MVFCQILETTIRIVSRYFCIVKKMLHAIIFIFIESLNWFWEFTKKDDLKCNTKKLKFWRLSLFYWKLISIETLNVFSKTFRQNKVRNHTKLLYVEACSRLFTTEVDNFKITWRTWSQMHSSSFTIGSSFKIVEFS